MSEKEVKFHRSQRLLNLAKVSDCRAQICYLLRQSNEIKNGSMINDAQLRVPDFSWMEFFAEVQLQFRLRDRQTGGSGVRIPFAKARVSRWGDNGPTRNYIMAMAKRARDQWREFEQ